MSVFGDHAIADHLRAARKMAGQRDEDGLAVGTKGDVIARLALRIDQADSRRRDAFIETQLCDVRRLGHHAAVGRLGRNQRRKRTGGKTKNRQQRSDPSGKAHGQGFGISLTPGAGDLPPPWSLPPRPSAGMSIQRLIPCSHSCTTGKYSVVFGFRPPVRKVETTNSS